MLKKSLPKYSHLNKTERTKLLEEREAEKAIIAQQQIEADKIDLLCIFKKPILDYNKEDLIKVVKELQNMRYLRVPKSKKTTVYDLLMKYLTVANAEVVAQTLRERLDKYNNEVKT